MIHLSNGYCFEYVAASGVLGFDGRGWPWEPRLRWLVWQSPKLFTIVIKTLTEQKEKGNFVWNPFKVIKRIPDGLVNAVGLKGPGIDWWCNKCGPKIDWSKVSLVGSIYSEDIDALCRMAEKLNDFPFEALEINSYCPNVKSENTLMTEFAVGACKRVQQVSRHPIILKITVVQDYKEIVRQTFGIAEAISINSVPWEIAFPGKKSPLEKFGNGAVSGGAAQRVNWRAVKEIAFLDKTPVIAPSIWRDGDIGRIRNFGKKVQAESFGAGLSCHPGRMLRMIQRDQENNSRLRKEK